MSRHLLTLVALASLLPTGCAAWRAKLQPPTTTQQRQQRRVDAVQNFEEHRDEAQLQAALDRWSQGDVAGCETRLRALLARHPQNTAVRLRLAELLWTAGEAPQAETELLQVLVALPEHAEAHHLLGMLLAEQNRLSEARTHLSRAVELEPVNELYRETHDALPAAASS